MAITMVFGTTGSPIYASYWYEPFSTVRVGFRTTKKRRIEIQQETGEERESWDSVCLNCEHGHFQVIRRDYTIKIQLQWHVRHKSEGLF